MVPKTLLIKPQKLQLLSMFYLRGLCFAKDFLFLAISAFFVLGTCKACSLTEVQNFEVEACMPVQQLSLQNICPPSNSFCFPSTLTGFPVDEIDAESKSPDASDVQSEGFSSGLKQTRSNLSLLPHRGIFKLFDGRIISCSLHPQDAFLDFPPLCKETKSSKTGENAEIVLDGLSKPPVEIKPSVLDWGNKSRYYPSIAFLTLKNMDDHNHLNVYEPYISNTQFYPCNSSEVLLVAPGESTSICFVFYPIHLGSSSAQLVLQTSFGGFLIQAKGFAVESPFSISLDIASSGRWRKKLSLFNPLDEAVYVKEVTAWISTFSKNTSLLSKFICRIHSVEDFEDSNAKDWLDVEKTQIAMRPFENWEVGPRKTETIMELDISDHFEGNIAAVFCLHLSRPSKNKIDTVMVSLEADTCQISVSLEALAPCNTSGAIFVALSVRNNGPYVLSVVKVSEVGENETFQIKSVEGLVLFPGTITRVATFNYDSHMEKKTPMNCKILVLINDTRSSRVEIPCSDVMSVCSGFTKGIVNIEEADEMVLKNWKSHAKASFFSVLDKTELDFSTVMVGNYTSQWISVKNPSQEPVLMQLILNSGEVVDNCRKNPEKILQPSSTSIISGSNKSVAPANYGFSIEKDALTEAYVHPHGSAVLGPIIFQPSNRCEWISSALIRNNLSGVEWLSLRGFGGSFSLVLLEGYNEYDPVNSLEFKLNFPSRLNLTSKKTPLCSQPLTKDVYAKNLGDFPLEVVKIKVSGAECGLDGFVVENCNGFSLKPGESAKIHISYRSDFSTAIVQRDLELALTNGIFVIPMKASLPSCMLSFCKRSIFLVHLKKALVVMVFGGSLVYLVGVFLFPRVITPFMIKSGEKSFFSGMSAFSDWKNGILPLIKNGFVRSITGEEEAPFLESDGFAPEQGHVNVNPSSTDAQDSKNMKVRVGKDKGRRRRKKKSSGGAGGVLLLEASSSQSGNSTPSSPLSPRRPFSACPVIEQQSVEDKNPFSRAPFKQNDKKTKPLEPSLNNVKTNNYVEKLPNSNLSRKMAGRAVLLPSATFPSAGYSPFLASTSTIAPHARAPGTKLHNLKDGGLEEKEKKVVGVFEEKYTYDIWGDHLFGLNLVDNLKKVSSASMCSSPIGNDSQSFFVRGPQTLMKNAMLLPPVSSVLEGNE